MQGRARGRKGKRKTYRITRMFMYLYTTSTLRGYTVKHPVKRGDYKAPVVHASNASKKYI